MKSVTARSVSDINIMDGRSNLNRWLFNLIVCCLFVLIIPAKIEGQSWYNPSWAYRKAITIDFTKVGAGPHTNIPILVSITDANLQTGALSTGNDILFTSSDGITKLAHEIEIYTSVSGILAAWVNIPSLSSSVNTVIYMYYGNAGAASQQNVIGTWNAAFKGVYHLNNSYLDATSNNFDGTNTGTIDAAGKISRGRSFVRSNGADYITITGLMSNPTSFTLSSWANLTTADANGADVISLGDHVGLRLDENSANSTCGVTQSGSGTWNTTGSGNDYAGLGWRYYSYTYDDVGNTQKFYVNGIQVGASSFTNAPYYAGGGVNTFIGKHGNGNTGMDFDGTIDEVHVASSIRSVGWVLTEFNNQNSPSTFHSVGSQVALGPVRFAVATGNWNATSTWSATSGGTAGASVPIAGDNVIIERNFTVHVTANAACGSLQVGSPGINGSGVIDYTGPFSLTVTGNTAFGGYGMTTRTGTITFSNGSSLITGSLDLGNDGATPAAGVINMTAGGTLRVNGSISVNTVTGNTWTPGTGTVIMTATNTIPATIFTTFNDLTILSGSWIATDACGNSTEGIQVIDWMPNSLLVCDIEFPAVIDCNTHGVAVAAIISGGFGPYTYTWEIVGAECFIQAGQGTPNALIYIGFTQAVLSLTITDSFGCTTVCSAIIDCVYPLNGLSGASVDINPETNNTIIPTQSDILTGQNDYLHELSLRPNPVAESLFMSFESTMEGEVVVSIINFLGQEMLSEKMNARKGHNAQKIDVSHIPDGSYMVHVKTENDFHTKIVVIMHQ